MKQTFYPVYRGPSIGLIKALLDKAMNQNIGFPSWYYGATTLYFYRQYRYELAYNEAIQYDLPGLFWGPLLRAACLGQLQRQEETEQQIAHLLELKPDFQEKARMLIKRFVKEEELVEHIIEGLQKIEPTALTESQQDYIHKSTC